MYSTHNESKSVVAERSIRILKTSISKIVYIDKLDDIHIIIYIVAQLKWTLLMQNQTNILTLVTYINSLC